MEKGCYIWHFSQMWSWHRKSDQKNRELNLYDEIQTMKNPNFLIENWGFEKTIIGNYLLFLD